MSALVVNFATVLQLSLADAPPTEAILPALDWIRATLFGSIATVIAVIAVASIGFRMLSGKLSVRQGSTILLGCFILFGASILAKGLLSFIDEENRSYDKLSEVGPPILIRPYDQSRQVIEKSYDPYAGASVQR